MLSRRRGYYSAYSTTVGRSRTSDTRPGKPSWFLPVSARRPRLPPRQRQVNGGGRTRAYNIVIYCNNITIIMRFVRLHVNALFIPLLLQPSYIRIILTTVIGITTDFPFLPVNFSHTRYEYIIHYLHFPDTFPFVDGTRGAYLRR